jgi:starch synthase (maltosyl-transferring)
MAKKATQGAPKEQRRVQIEAVTPEIDGGRFAVKRIVGDRVEVQADLVADGHDHLAGRVAFRHAGDRRWHEAPLEPIGNDRWRAAFDVERVGRWLYTVVAWVDSFETWRYAFEKKVQAGQDVGVELQEGSELVRQAAERAATRDGRLLERLAGTLADRTTPEETRAAQALSDELRQLMSRYPDRSRQTAHRELALTVDRERARFSTWYELFPRSWSRVPGRHGTFRDVIEALPYVAELGFDVLYLPPIHPIGKAYRKGKNNAEICEPGDPGSPWAIGASTGGHKTIHPELGTLDDFHALVAAAEKQGLEIALDIAFQCSPDHPYVKEHPGWFRWRADGTVQYAENPPKKYQDIYPFHFDGDEWRSLWDELYSVFEFWAEQGVRIFRVDNPHTKPFAFWEWVIAELKKKYPEVIFLAEAFTRPKIMYALAKLGFTQSYTYFTWRNHKQEITEYFEELTQTGVADFFRPNLWPNTPDILHEVLQTGGRPAFMMRYVLAGTLAGDIGMYGPVYELCENVPREPGIEENRDNEKYEIREWDLEAAHSIAPLIRAVNRARHDNPALQSNERLLFHQVDNDRLLVYSKHSADRSNIILVAINLDPFGVQGGNVHLALEPLGLGADESYQVLDLLTGTSFSWHGAHNYVQLDPQVMPAHLFQVQRTQVSRGARST